MNNPSTLELSELLTQLHSIEGVTAVTIESKQDERGMIVYSLTVKGERNGKPFITNTMMSLRVKAVELITYDVKKQIERNGVN